MMLTIDRKNAASDVAELERIIFSLMELASEPHAKFKIGIQELHQGWTQITSGFKPAKMFVFKFEINDRDRSISIKSIVDGCHYERNDTGFKVCDAVGSKCALFVARAPHAEFQMNSFELIPAEWTHVHATFNTKQRFVLKFGVSDDGGSITIQSVPARNIDLEDEGFRVYDEHGCKSAMFIAFGFL